MSPQTNENSRFRLVVTFLLPVIATFALIDLSLAPLSTLMAVRAAFTVASCTICLFAMAYLWIDWARLDQSLSRVKAALGSREAELEEWRQRTQGEYRNLGEEIEAQFTRWGLAPAERQVAVLLLKGCGLRDIAVDLGKSEFTVRAQSTYVYRKSGLSSRAELTGFFLGGLLALPGTELEQDKGTQDASGSSLRLQSNNKGGSLQLVVILLLPALSTLALIDLIFSPPSSLLSIRAAFTSAFVAVSLLSTAYLWIHWMRIERALSSAEGKVAAREAEFEELRQRMQRSHRDLGEEIDAQLKGWGLSPMERQVALHLLKGWGGKEIAARLEMSSGSVRQHSMAVYRKSGLSSRAELAAFFLENLSVPGTPLDRDNETRDMAASSSKDEEGEPPPPPLGRTGKMRIVRSSD
jgi:DNA-binding NarL/FixJ family response regulator